ncbi:Reverse transcriptase domain [Trinorchestia longiramus]|nr:Reverse transcriptase domain [Trinorchestia longiramus]
MIPMLFNLMIYDNPIQTGVQSCEYTDDLTFFTAHKDLHTATDKLQTQMDSLNKWSQQWGLKINYTKTKTMCFTNKRDYYNQDVHHHVADYDSGGQFTEKDKITSFDAFKRERNLPKQYKNLIISRSKERLVCLFMTDNFSECSLSVIAENKPTVCSPLTLRPGARETFDEVQTLQKKNVFLLVDEVQIRPTVSFSGGLLSGMAENNRACKATSILITRNPSSPDLTIVSPHLALETSWTPLTRLNSDHLSIEFPSPPTNPLTTSPQDFHQHQQSNWEAFIIHTTKIFRNAPLPSSSTQGEAFIRLTLQTTANRFIHRGCRKDFIPYLLPFAILLINQRDVLCSTNPNDPSLPDLINNITSAISTHFRQTWIDKVQSHSLQQNLSGT